MEVNSNKAKIIERCRELYLTPDPKDISTPKYSQRKISQMLRSEFGGKAPTHKTVGLWIKRYEWDLELAGLLKTSIEEQLTGKIDDTPTSESITATKDMMKRIISREILLYEKMSDTIDEIYRQTERKDSMPFQKYDFTCRNYENVINRIMKYIDIDNKIELNGNDIKIVFKTED